MQLLITNTTREEQIEAVLHEVPYVGSLDEQEMWWVMACRSAAPFAMVQMHLSNVLEQTTTEEWKKPLGFLF